jgi:hypothetical protein
LLKFLYISKQIMDSIHAKELNELLGREKYSMSTKKDTKKSKKDTKKPKKPKVVENKFNITPYLKQGYTNVAINKLKRNSAEQTANNLKLNAKKTDIGLIMPGSVLAISATDLLNANKELKKLYPTVGELRAALENGEIDLTHGSIKKIDDITTNDVEKAHALGDMLNQNIVLEKKVKKRTPKAAAEAVDIDDDALKSNEQGDDDKLESIFNKLDKKGSGIRMIDANQNVTQITSDQFGSKFKLSPNKQRRQKSIIAQFQNGPFEHDGNLYISGPLGMDHKNHIKSFLNFDVAQIADVEEVIDDE